MNGYKYLLWVPGNCAALRLAAQLSSDAAVFKLDSPEIEWYYPLLQPWIHYIPVRCHHKCRGQGYPDSMYKRNIWYYKTIISQLPVYHYEKKYDNSVIFLMVKIICCGQRKCRSILTIRNLIPLSFIFNPVMLVFIRWHVHGFAKSISDPNNQQSRSSVPKYHVS